MEPTIEKIPPDRFPYTVAEELAFVIQEVIDQRGRCSIALSGGTTPASVYRRLGKPPFSEEIPWPKVELFFGDERWVPAEDPKNNSHMVKETLVSGLRVQQPQFFPVDTSLDSPAAAAERYSELLRSKGYFSGEEQTPIDIVLLGVGTDGHTASLFPGTSSGKKHSDELVVVTESPDETTRVSLSFPALFSSPRVYFLATGKRKAPIIRELLATEADPEQLPAAQFKAAEGRVVWFLDTEAADELSGGS